MNRRLNYTGRKKIERADTTFSVKDNPDGIATFGVGIELAEYEFPADASVYIEAQRLTSFMRFECGTVGDLVLPAAEARRLTDIGTADGVSFRVKVVESGDGVERPARLLGLADGIRPLVDDSTQTLSLLEIIQYDTGAEAWRLLFHDDGHPKLGLPPALFSSRFELLPKPWFSALILPAILRAVLVQVKCVDQHDDLEDGEQWRSQWLRLGARLTGINPPAWDQAAEVEDWIDEVVAAFGRRHESRQKFEAYWVEESQS